MPAFDDLHEVMLYVENMDRMLEFYRDVMGLDIAGGDPAHGFVELDTGSTTLCLHAGSNGDIGSSAPKLVFAVDDLDDAAAHLRAHDVELGEKRNPAPGVHVIDGRDPEGHAFSIEHSDNAD